MVGYASGKSGAFAGTDKTFLLGTADGQIDAVRQLSGGEQARGPDDQQAPGIMQG